MTAATNDAAKVLPPKDFLLKDYELKVGYLTQQFGRMWTRFNYFIGIESALVGGKLIFGNGKLSPEIAIVGAVVSLIWYVMGAEDRFLVRVYRGHVKDGTPPICFPRRCGMLPLTAPIGTWVKWLSRRRDLTGNSAVGGWNPSAPRALRLGFRCWCY